jgi:hypothetical protein
MSFGSVLSIGSFASIVSVMSALSRAGALSGPRQRPRTDAEAIAETSSAGHGLA